ncbi:hypothetical protein EOA37_09560 [Mesorhizobium sp. M2A.F.Ca.ET.015.02.1.1]|uniref:hypothetical protein n=1 Tax=Mesorhizobium sp. M2A.F.Ca.ET.015.02.1.1 TaxID=2496758 RepID=UPI000FCA7D21|nr:hypothetical protein [Mesorhizobium sp. M2A.F.Ca.ET.015.02.1.1]RUW41498.1 hypothetical protein EOA37_09560 [Mesorhizobium sp. M2A.F.Ca.ET.015.02.1.1]
MSTEAWKAENTRQTNLLAVAIQETIDEFGRKTLADGSQPLLNAVAGALVTVTGAMLAQVEDRWLRKELQRKMERELPRAIANGAWRGSSPIVVAGRRTDA